MMNDLATPHTLTQQFQASSQTQKKRDKRSPFTLRFTEEERAWLDKQAGRMSLGAYIRQVALADYEGKTTFSRRKPHKPTVDQQKISALLAGLGQSQIPNNLNQLAKAAHTGTLGTAEEVEQQLQDACAAVHAMREALFMALGLRCGGGVP